MTTSGSNNQFSHEVCKLKHAAVDAEIRRNREESDKTDSRLEKRIDRLEAMMKWAGVTLLAFITGIMSPLIVDQIKKILILTGK